MSNASLVGRKLMYDGTEAEIVGEETNGTLVLNFYRKGQLMSCKFNPYNMVLHPQTYYLI